jgi:hypothetical protein
MGDSQRKVLAERPDPATAALSIQVDQGVPANVLAALETAEADRSEGQKMLVEEHFKWAVPELQSAYVEVAKLEAERSLVDSQVPRVVATETMRPRVTRILARGNFLDESGEIVEPAIPGFLGRLQTEKRATRLDLANWIISPQNPLTARVLVNRLWRQFFGVGLSKTLEDLGSQGEWPVHPELLDWLAAEFMQPGEVAHAWDVKHMMKTIVMSQTYRQSSLTNPQLDARDPDNRLLGRQSRFRVDAEIVHDTLLAVSGLLAEKHGGPSVKPYEPEGYLTAMNFPKREYAAGRGDDLYRRALYTQWQRTFLHPSLLAFDAPTREECTVNRVNSNTPLQALVLLNDPIYVEAARVFAQNILRAGPSKFDDQLDWAYQRALNRTPEKEERRILADLYRKNLVRFRQRAEDARSLIAVGEAPLAPEIRAAELAAMTTVARAILNLDEAITRN